VSEVFVSDSIFPGQAERPIRKLLWTGGWDSTFRLLHIFQSTPDYVRPYYAVVAARRSTGMEVLTMGRIRKTLERHNPEWNQRLLPTRYLNGDMDDGVMHQTIDRLRSQSWVGYQYAKVFCAAAAECLDMLELCIHRDDSAYEFVGSVATLGADGIWRLPLEITSSNLKVFAPFVFPILDWTKLEMQDYATRHGLAHYLELTWFCHRPRGNRPCGVCNPCKYTAREGLKRRIPISARVYATAEPHYRRARKLLRLLSGRGRH
jgi:hypothetical protein